MRHYLLVSFFFLTEAFSISAQCNPKEYFRIVNEASKLQEKGAFIDAKNRYEAAKIYACNQKDKDEADGQIDALFDQIELLRKLADSTAETNHRQTLTAFANDLAYKSQIALRDGNRSSAFRLVEFAQKYVEGDNLFVNRMLFDIIYYNEDDTHPALQWIAEKGENTSTIESIEFSPDGKKLATGSRDGTVKIWNSNNGAEILTLNAHMKSIEEIAFSATGKNLLTTSIDGTSKIWNLENKKNTHVIKNSKWEFGGSGLFSSFPDGTQFATCSNVGTVKIHKYEGGETLLVKFPKKRLIPEAFFSDGTIIAIMDYRGLVKTWNIIDNKAVFNLEFETLRPDYGAFSQDGKKLAIISSEGDEDIEIWDVSSGKKDIVLSGHVKNIWKLIFSPDGKTLATVSDDHTIVEIWDLNDGKRSQVLNIWKYGVFSIAFSPDGKTIATGTGFGIPMLWELVGDKKILDGHTKDITSIAFVPNYSVWSNGKRWQATGSIDGTAKIWDLNTGKAIYTFTGHTSSVKSVTFSGNCEWLATGSGDGTAKIWDITQNQESKSFSGHTANITSVAFSPDDKLLATGSSDKTAKIWDVVTGEEVKMLVGHDSYILSVTFSPNGKWLATGSEDGSLKIWNINTGEAIFTINLDGSPITSVKFSPDGQWLALGSGDKTARLWDLNSKKEIFTLSGHTGYVSSVAFSTDGKKLATGSWDKTAKIWDLATGDEILTVKENLAYISGVAFSPDNNWLAIATMDKKSKIWALSPDTLIALGLGHSIPKLSVTQLKEFNLDMLFDLNPKSETVLSKTNDVDQLSSFADLYVQKITRTGIPKKEDYERALRLYTSCLLSGVNVANYERKLADLQALWKKKMQ